MNITGRPIYQKTGKPEKPKRTGLRAVSKKRQAARASTEGRDNIAYLAAVHDLPCVACGAYGVEAHHCRDLPDHAERGIYERMPGAGIKSADRDAIPLCPPCHWAFHNRRGEFHAAHGKDYRYIAQTRAAIDERLSE